MRRTRHHRTAALTAASVLLAGYAAGPVLAAEGDARPRGDGFGASCRTTIEGSQVTAHCHNPYPRTDRVQLHVECDRWWDVDADSRPVDIGPTAYAELTERCWKEVRSAWLSHQPVPPQRSSGT
ncbi:hypothetical protein ACFPM3_30765 [Streptomyces coeruleoprunus]|uniref:Secreted protein n=1 Tax=Streptomyces coeruleoprunus TaxID=285563 RepID=A0ABV9XN28_9ACTN